MSIQELLEKCRAAKEGNQELDAEIMALFYTRGERHIGAYIENDLGRDEAVMDAVWINPETDKWVSTHPYEFTTSVDAILSLIKTKLPGWAMQMYTTPESCVVCLEQRFGPAIWGATRPDLPLALCCAFLSAMQAQPSGGQE